MKRLFTLLVGLLLATISCHVPAAGQQTLSVGLFPNLSARQLVETYQPLREFLELRLGRPVMLYTAPDFKGFVSRTQSGEYDVIVTAPHFARLAQIDAGYQPLFAYRSDITAALVVPAGSRIGSFAQLRGAKIIAPGHLALVTMLGQKLLHDHGLDAGRDYALQETATHGNVALAVLRGEAQAGIIGVLPLKQLAENTTRQLRILSLSPAVPSQMLLAHPALAANQIQQIKEALLQFEQSPAGQKFFQSSGLAGLKPVSAADLKQLDPYAKEVKRLLDQPN
ncbi:hypothetical protein SKTS_35750 [Sulfurimicrobium lacus]|uniref:Phosphate ABC transporter substrate-binding protein n=1 Tax=Sulfurimicrobium lacus TaxID=2715678 RepID=A0A6F8VIZ2_9PROT|nr:phosphate/phosphite/phosphonate ABC transporter substrate-binding protein [Sulfurimicrobium lacus]BCB28689.1 hypothetical protein SKTS_35750 [Sulfurimicrobium lacus]